jgi:hypothetical protein
MERARTDFRAGQAWFYWTSHHMTLRRAPMLDVLYIGLTIIVFAALFLLVKGVERFER